MTTAEWIDLQFPPDFKGYAVELGALDGVNLSNTLHLEQRGWTVLCIEPNPRHHEALTKNRKLVMRCACDSEPRVRAKLFEVAQIEGDTYTALRFDNPYWKVPPQGFKATYETTVLTLDQCLVVAGFPRLDVLSLDVDGLEREILIGLDVPKWKPKVVVVEEIGPVGLMADLLIGYREDFYDAPTSHYVREEA
jgi:FkbM family methyltransferase